MSYSRYLKQTDFHLQWLLVSYTANCLCMTVEAIKLRQCLEGGQYSKDWVLLSAAEEPAIYSSPCLPCRGSRTIVVLCLLCSARQRSRRRRIGRA